MNLPKPKSPTQARKETDRFYRLDPDGKWQKKTQKGSYEELNTKQILKGPQLSSAAGCTRRFE